MPQIRAVITMNIERVVFARLPWAVASMSAISKKVDYTFARTEDAIFAHRGRIFGERLPKRRQNESRATSKSRSYIRC